MTARLVVDGVSKAYPRWTGEPSLRAAVRHRLPALLRPAERRWALEDVSLVVRAGQAVGVVGTNGAGKSTLLRLAAGIAHPTRGRVLAPDRTAAVLTLGDVFDPALTGRENAVTTALAAGLRLQEARARIGAVLEFAELESFADAPVRTYSDGMRLRLAFGVVAQLEPDLLLLDEVIAVGDLRFQRKCMDWLRERRSHGAGVLFASHSLETVQAECDDAIWLDAGGVRAAGAVADVVAAYRAAMDDETRARTPAPKADGGAAPLELRRNRFGSQEAQVAAVTLRGEDGREVGEIASGAPLEVALDLRCETEVDDPIVGVALVRAADGTVCYDTSTAAAGLRLGTLRGERRVTLSFDRLDLMPGAYFVDVGVYEADWRYAYDFHWHAHGLAVTGQAADSGVFRPPHAWRA